MWEDRRGSGRMGEEEGEKILKGEEAEREGKERKKRRTIVFKMSQ